MILKMKKQIKTLGSQAGDLEARISRLKARLQKVEEQPKKVVRFQELRQIRSLEQIPGGRGQIKKILEKEDQVIFQIQAAAKAELDLLKMDCSQLLYITKGALWDAQNDQILREGPVFLEAHQQRLFLALESSEFFLKYFIPLS